MEPFVRILALAAAMAVVPGASAASEMQLTVREPMSLVFGPAGAAFEGTEAAEANLGESVRAAAEAFGALDVIADLNGSADYKRHLAGVLLGRAAQSALREAVAHA